MPTFYDLVPSAENFLALEPEELAGVLMEYLNMNEGPWSKHNVGMAHSFLQYPREYHERIQRALMEAWSWADREGLIAENPAQNGWYFVTRRGKKIKSTGDLNVYRLADMLPRRLLHPTIASKVWATFLRGDYDTAVFQSFKEVEVAVRGAGKFADEDLGVSLMRKAFHPTDGPLTDKCVVASERQAVSDLFSGAIGSYKNPHSHRNVAIDAGEAVEMIMLASHLLKIVDSRPASSGS